MSTVILDTITGKSTATTITIGSTPVVSASANSMTIRGEGSAQTSIQQGLNKAFVHGDISANVVASQSFNIGSGTDHATGKFSFVITSAMASADYLGFVTANHSNVRNAQHHATNNTASVLAVTVDDSGTYADAPYNACSLGDLA